MNNIPVRQPWQMWPGAISSELVDEITAKCEEREAERGIVVHGPQDMRTSIIRWVTDVEGVRDLLWRYAEAANHNAFFISVMPIGLVQFTEYHATEGGHYDAHIDVNWDNNDSHYDRKISITMQLSDPSDYEGGEFFFQNVENPDQALLRQKGTILAFPSYLRHGVSPVTRGIRKSLVCWFEGDRWR